ncbi:hypothetical protein Sango_2869600 [Sesamum angolense]|uniref:DUF4283 domain-containing protein n=1 Tax=Sesamum angolense TaxID=2727404 RepID=A0AAE1T6I9_9LAMI|nr:hypothetical protein Sango_2869600 [Sesamum angolense]
MKTTKMLASRRSLQIKCAYSDQSLNTPAHRATVTTSYFQLAGVRTPRLVGVPPIEYPLLDDSNAIPPIDFHSIFPQITATPLHAVVVAFCRFSPPSDLSRRRTTSFVIASQRRTHLFSSIQATDHFEMVSFSLNSIDFPSLIRKLPESTQPNSDTYHAHPNPENKSFSEAVSHNASGQTSTHRTEFSKFFLVNSKPASVGSTKHINGRPTIIFSDLETQSHVADFCLALIENFSHGSPPYSQLHRLLANSGLKGAFTVSMINNKHALISLSNKSDYTRLWWRRIWYFNGLPMRVFKWSPTFTPDHESSVVPIWVNFPELPAYLFHKDVLGVIPNLIGTPLQIDDSTHNKSKQSTAQVCIAIDLLKPLLEDFDLKIHDETIRQRIEYEQVPAYCTLWKKSQETAATQDASKVFDGKADRNVGFMEKGECSKTTKARYRRRNEVVTEDGHRGTTMETAEACLIYASVDIPFEDAENHNQVVDDDNNVTAQVGEKKENNLSKRSPLRLVQECNSSKSDLHRLHHVLDAVRMGRTPQKCIGRLQVVVGAADWASGVRMEQLLGVEWAALSLLFYWTDAGNDGRPRWADEMGRMREQWAAPAGAASTTHHHHITTHLTTQPLPEDSPPPAPPRRRHRPTVGIFFGASRPSAPPPGSLPNDPLSRAVRVLIHIPTSPPSVGRFLIGHHRCTRLPMEQLSPQPISGTGASSKMELATPYSAEFPPLNSQNPVNPFSTKSTQRATSHPQPDQHNPPPTNSTPQHSPANNSDHNLPNQQPPKIFAEAVSTLPTSRPKFSHISDLRKFFLADSKPAAIGVKLSDEELPVLTFSDSETEDLAASYRFALIEKFSHGTPQYRNLHHLIVGFGLKGGFTISIINNKHVLISLPNESDYSRLWLKRIWYLQGFPMRVFKWSPTFTPSQESSIVPIWVCLPELPAHLYRKDALFAVASMVGTLLQIDEYTVNQSKLAKARMCV